MYKHGETIIHLIKSELITAINKQTELIEDFGINVFDLNVQVEQTKNPKFGDYATNTIMSLGLPRDKTMIFAQKVADVLPKKYFSSVSVINPGFVNMVINPAFNVEIIDEVLSKQDSFGTFEKKKSFYNIEFVSANPTGLLHIGHARNAAIGDSLARI
jgi:arginyl-tRNA synthetase